MTEQDFLKIIEGRSQGFGPACLRLLLLPLSWGYGLAMTVRNRLYDGGWAPQTHVSVPVIAVGNLTTGGTGKTPVVAWIVQQLQQFGLQPGIVSRGYGADSSGHNDEHRVLQQLCPGVPHVQNPSRVAAAQTLIEQHHVNAIVLDDAFQHRRMARDLNVVLIDATNPFGFGHLLPRGLLREPVRGLSRAQIVLITRSDRVTDSELRHIEQHICRASPSLKGHIHRVQFQPTGLISSDNSRPGPQISPGQPAIVMTAIGNPQAFVKTCEAMGADVVATRFFPDHHRYTTQDLDEVRQLAQNAGVSLILNTLKDLVKIPPGDERFQAVQIETVFPSDRDLQKVRDELKSATKMKGRA